MYITSLNDDLVPAVISLLSGMRNLKTLSIKSSPPLLANTNISSTRIHCNMKCSKLFTDYMKPSLRFHRSIKSSTPLAKNNASGFNARYWESQNLRFIRHLEMVEIGLSDGGMNEVELGLFLEAFPKLSLFCILFLKLSLLLTDFPN
ncbi:hypothetical protein ACSBR1_005054 [Camellia fascicularis]